MNKVIKVVIGFIIAVSIYAVATGGNAGNDCDKIVYANQVPQWIQTKGGQVSYTHGKWYDKDGVLIGTSGTEDSDICEK